MDEPELPLYPPTVFRETLWGENYFKRMAELRAEGSRVEFMDQVGSNGVWLITYRKSSGRDSKLNAAPAADTSSRTCG